MRFLLGIILGILLVPAGLLLWIRYATVPVAVTDPPLPMERQITSVPLNARIEREMPKSVPIEANEATFVAGARIYRQQCAFCHGLSGSPPAVGTHMFPGAPPLWQKHRNGDVVGVSDDAPGETYWKVANGIRLSGMPGYKSVLSDSEMWQVSVLLANADKPLPPAALILLKTPLTFDLGVSAPALASLPASSHKSPARNE